MAEEHTWSEQIKYLEEDISAEFLIFAMESLKKTNTLIFWKNGGFRRRYRKDIETILAPDHFKYKNKSILVEVNRDGLYDQFPEYLFHQTKNKKHFKSVTELKDEYQFQQEVEFNARRFFWPLDNQLLKTRGSILSFELLLGQQGTQLKKDYLRRFWMIPEFFDTVQARLLSGILPLAKEITCNLQWMQEAISDVLRVQVRIEKKFKHFQRTAKAKVTGMGYARLGIDTIIGNHYTEAKYGLEVAIGPVSVKRANQLSSGGQMQKQLDYLFELLCPMDMDVNQTIIPKPNFSMTLSDDIDHCSILGVSSIISN